MTFEDYRDQYNSGLYSDMNSLFRLDPKKLKNQKKIALHEKNKALIQAQKAYQEATPENKQTAQANLQNAQQAKNDAESAYTSMLSKTEKDLYNVGQAGKAAGKAFVSGVKQQFTGNKNNSSVTSTQAKDTQSQLVSKQGQEQSAEQKGTNFGQKAAQAVGTVANMAGNALGSIINAKNINNRVNDLNGPQKEEIRNTQMRGADAAKYRDAYMQKATVGTDSYTSKQASTDSKQKQETRQERTGAADGDASLMVDDASSGDLQWAENFQNENLANANKQSQEVFNARSAANKMRGKMQNEAYGQGQMTDYNNQSNNLSNANGGQQEAAQTESRQPAQVSDNAQTTDEESTGAKDFSFQIPANEVQGVINAVTGHEKGVDIRNGGGTPAQQQYYKYLISNGVKVPNVYTPADKFSEMNDINKQAMNAMTNIRSGGDPTKNYVQGKDGKYYAEGTGEKMNEDQIIISNAVNNPFGWR